jgi:hypothetical protein
MTDDAPTVARREPEGAADQMKDADLRVNLGCVAVPTVAARIRYRPLGGGR